MNLETATLLAKEEMIEREGKGKIPEMRSAQPGGGAKFGTGWQYGQRHALGYIPTRTLAGLPAVKKGGGHMPALPKPQAPKMPHSPNPSMGHKSAMPKSGHFKTSPSMHIKAPKMPSAPKMPHMPRMKLSNTEGTEPPRTGAYSKQNRHETEDWFKEKPMKAYGTSEGTQKGWESRQRAPEWNPYLEKEQERAGHKPGQSYPEQFGLPHEAEKPPMSLADIKKYQEWREGLEEEGGVPSHPGDAPLVYLPPQKRSATIDSFGTSEGAEKGWDERGRKIYEIPYTGTGKPNFRITTTNEKGETTVSYRKTRERAERDIGVAKAEGWKVKLEPLGEIKADVDGEPGGPAMTHAHIQPIDTQHPPSLTKRNKQTHVPTDDVGETDDKWLDVTKRNSKQTHEERMKLLKRQAPGGSPPQIPAYTTSIPFHQGVSTPMAMFSSSEKRLKQRPVNWDRQPKMKVSYNRRGCI